jgi:hypothetical protein
MALHINRKAKISLNFDFTLRQEFESEFDVDRHRAVIASKDVISLPHFPYLVFNAAGDQKVIDPPSGIVGSGVESVGPPGVCIATIRV